MSCNCPVLSSSTGCVTETTFFDLFFATSLVSAKCVRPFVGSAASTPHSTSRKTLEMHFVGHSLKTLNFRCTGSNIQGQRRSPSAR